MQIETVNIPVAVKYIKEAELSQLQKDYALAELEGHKWAMQAMDRVLRDIDLGAIRVLYSVKEPA